MKRIKVLVFPCGSEVGLEIAQALGHSLHVRLHGASSREDHGRQAFQRYAELPNISEADFDLRFGQLLRERGIELIFATHDSVQAYLAARAGQWGVHLVNGDPQASRIARSKEATYALFEGEAWLPARFACLDQVNRWPVVIKPDQGQGGQAVTIAADRLQAEAALRLVAQPLICEYLPGEEMTVDCFSDRHGRLLFAGARSRERLLGGIATRSQRADSDAAIDAIALRINAALRLRGPWFFQVKRDLQGDWKLLEISCRLSSSSVAQRAAGVNLPLMAVQDYMGRDLKVLHDRRISLLERRLASNAVLEHAFDKVYIDLDDTLICDGVANPQAMRFLYRLLQMGKRLLLVTRHAGEPQRALKDARIAAELFDEIIHLRADEPKSSVVQPGSIFIDNHFPERMDVSVNCGVPVFDVDALELLFP